MKHLMAIDVEPFVVQKMENAPCTHTHTHVFTYFTFQINGNINGFLLYIQSRLNAI
jgi:hypothetical protein